MNGNHLLKILFFLFISLLSVFDVHAQTKMVGKRAAKPLFRDPVYDGAADPVVIWNKKEKMWFMLYTNRRASLADSSGVQWVHGTRIGIATSVDGGATWKYRDTANINYRPDSGYTFWAPDVVESNGLYHMFLTYVPGVFSDWQHPRVIVHLTSSDLLNWKYESTLNLASEKVIDASLFPLPDGSWRMWYNNEKDKKSIYYADSKDLFHWQDKGKAIGDRGEGPKVFQWKNKYWMIIDKWMGLGVFSSDDLLNWKGQPQRLLEEPGKGLDDQAIGGHCDVVVSADDRAYLFYFTHPGRSKAHPAPPGSFEAKRSLIQVVELKYDNGVLTCDRDQPTYISLKPKKNK